MYLQQTVDGLKIYHNPGNIATDARKGAFIVVVEENGQIVGTGTLTGTYVKRVFVHPAHQRRDIGNTVMEMIEAEVRKNGLLFVELYATLPSEVFYLKRDYLTIDLSYNPEVSSQLEYFRMMKTFRPFTPSINIDGFQWKISRAADTSFLCGIEEAFATIQKGGCVYVHFKTSSSNFAEMIGIFTSDTELIFSAHYIEFNKEWRSEHLELTMTGIKKLGNGVVAIDRIPV